VAPPPATRRHPTRGTLRRRLVLLVVALLIAVVATMATFSTVALRSSLLTQLDDRLKATNARALFGPDGDDQGGRPPTAGTADESDTGALPTVAPTDTPSGFPTFPAGESLGGLSGRGQDVGTANVIQRGDVTFSALVGASGALTTLTDAQQTTLLSLPRDGSPRHVELPDLGDYRAVATTFASGDIVVTALPTRSITATVQRYVVVELLVGLVGALVAGALGSLLLRRELRPLVRVAATATRVAQLPLAKGEVAIAERVDLRDTDPQTEVGQVGAAVNQMLGHVESALAARHDSEQQVRQFVADASHELRTPLASIRGYAELVRRSPDELPPQARHALDRVESETVRMTALVSDMLLLARLDSGRPLVAEPVDLGGLAIDAVADAHAASPDHVWRLELPGSGQDGPWVPGTPGTTADGPTGSASDPTTVPLIVPVTSPMTGDDELSDADLDALADLETSDDDPSVQVVGDEDRLRQVLGNLLSNARVHTPAGTHVTVRVRQEGDEAVIEVQDDGPGIPEPLRSRLFQRFTRGDASRNRSSGSSSTGLGMAIAHAVVSAHHGTMTVDSRPGSTTFVVRLPAVAG